MAYDLPIVPRARRNRIIKLQDMLGPAPTAPTIPNVPTPTPMPTPMPGPTPGPVPTPPAPRASMPAPPTAWTPISREYTGERARSPIPTPTQEPAPMPTDVTQSPYDPIPTTGFDPLTQSALAESGIVIGSEQKQALDDMSAQLAKLHEMPEYQDYLDEQARRRQSGIPVTEYHGPWSPLERLLAPMQSLEDYGNFVAYNAWYGIQFIQEHTPNIVIPGDPLGTPGYKGKIDQFMSETWDPPGPIDVDESIDAQRKRMLPFQSGEMQLRLGRAGRGEWQRRSPGEAPVWTGMGGFGGAIERAIGNGELPWYMTEPIKVFADPLEFMFAPVAKPLLVSAGLLARTGGRGVLTLTGAGVRRLPGVSLVIAQPAEAMTFVSSKVIYRTFPDGSVIATPDVAFNSGPFTSIEWSWVPPLTVPSGPMKMGPPVEQVTRMGGPKFLGQGGPNSAFIGPRLTNNAAVTLTEPNQYTVSLPNGVSQTFGFDPIRGGLTRMQTVGATVSKITQGAWGNFDDHGTAAGVAMQNNFLKAKYVAAIQSRHMADIAYSVFKVDNKGHIMSLALDIDGLPIDSTLGGKAPSISDLAARMPIYYPHLNPSQVEAMTKLKQFSEEFRSVLDEMGIPPPEGRADIMEGGFYLHRGSARPVRRKILGIELPKAHVSLSQFWRGKSGYRQADGAPSMSRAIEGITYSGRQGGLQYVGEEVYQFAGKEEVIQFVYPDFREAMRSYVQDVGEDIALAHSANYLEIAVDSETGLRLALSPDIRTPTGLMLKYTATKRQLASARESLARVTSQSTILRDNVARAHKEVGAQTARGERAGTAAEGRVSRATESLMAEQELLPTNWEVNEARRGLKGSIRSSMAISGNVAKLKGEISNTRRMTNKADQEIISLERRIERLTRESNEHYDSMVMEETPTPAQIQLAGEAEEIRTAIRDLGGIRTREFAYPDVSGTGNMARIRELQSALQDLEGRVTGLDAVEDAISEYQVIRTTDVRSRGARSRADIQDDITKTERKLSRASKESTIARHEDTLINLRNELEGSMRRRTDSEAAALEARIFPKIWRMVDKLNVTIRTTGEAPQPLRFKEGDIGPVSPLRYRRTAEGTIRTVQQPKQFTKMSNQESYVKAVNLANDLDEAVEELVTKSDEFLVELDGLLAGKANLESELADQIYKTRISMAGERNALKHDFLVSSLRRGLRSAELESGRIDRLMEREDLLAGTSLGAAELRATKNANTFAALGTKIDSLDTSIGDMSGAWKRDLQVSNRRHPSDRMLEMPGLGGYFFPDNVADAAKAYLKEDPKILGKAYDAFNSLYRGARGTMDNSYMLVQGLLRMYDDPVAFGGALKLNYAAWGFLPKTGTRGERAIDSYVRHATEQAIRKNLPTPAQLAGRGLVQTGADTEFILGSGFAAPLGKLPLIRNANRAFGATGDAMRLDWIYDLLEGMLKKKTYQQLVDSGDLDSMISMVNNATGWSKGRFAGVAGDILLFAPRFLQSRLTTLANSLRGLPSIATSPRGVYGLSVGGHQIATPGQRAAARSMLKLMTSVYLLTEGLNRMQGRDTDWRPVIKVQGRWVKNPNFGRVRAFGQDVSLAGTWDSLLGFIITAGSVTEGGGPHQAVRQLASGGVANAIDFISGTTAIGEPVRPGFKRIMYRVLSNFVPFSGEELVRQGKDAVDFANRINWQTEDAHELGESVTWGMGVEWAVEGMGRTGVMGWELFGGKSYPVSTREKTLEMRQARGQSLNALSHFDVDPRTNLARTDEELMDLDEIFSTDIWRFNDAWNDLGGDIRREIDDDPGINTSKALLHEERINRDDELASYTQSARDLRDGRDRLILEAQQEYAPEWTPDNLEGTILNPQEMLDVMRKIKHDYSLNLDNLKKTHDTLLTELEETRDEEGFFDKAFTRWAELMYDPDLEDSLGRIDWDQREANEATFDDEYKGYTGMKERILAYVNENDLPIEKHIDQLKEDLRPYWDVADQVKDMLIGPESPVSPKDQELLIQYLKMRDINKDGAGLIRSGLKRRGVTVEGLNVTIIELYEGGVYRLRGRLLDDGTDDEAHNRQAKRIDVARIRLGYGTRLETIEGVMERIKRTSGGLRQAELEGVR